MAGCVAKSFVGRQIESQGENTTVDHQDK